MSEKLGWRKRMLELTHFGARNGRPFRELTREEAIG
jgi:hypothetical protein